MIADANGKTIQHIVDQRADGREKKKSEIFEKSLSGFPVVTRSIRRAHLMAARKPLLR